MTWFKLNYIPIGRSSKGHIIIRSKKWNEENEKIFKRPVFNENYNKIGFIKDIFGPVNSPFISIKYTSKKEVSDSEFDPSQKLYVKI